MTSTWKVYSFDVLLTRISWCFVFDGKTEILRILVLFTSSVEANAAELMELKTSTSDTMIGLATNLS